MIISSIQDKYILGRWAYKIGASSLLSDAEYNSIHNSFVDLDILPEYTGRTWSEDPEPTELISKYEINFENEVNLANYDEGDAGVQHVLTSSMLTIDKDLDVEQKIKSASNGFRLSHKLDGWSIQVGYSGKEFQGALSRGRASDPLDLSGINTILPQTLSSERNITIVGELVVTKSGYREICNTIQLASERSAVRPALTRGFVHTLKFVAFAVYVGKRLVDTQEAYQFLRKNGFNTPEHYIIRNMSDYREAYTGLVSADKEGDVPTDGLVLQDLKTYECVALRVGHWENPIYYSYVTGYVPNYGEFDISLSAKIRPIRTKSGTQSQVNVYNMSYIKKFNLIKGAPIAFKLESVANAVIAEEVTSLLHMEHRNKWQQYKEEVEANEEYKAACSSDTYYADAPDSIDEGIDLDYLGIQ